MKMNLMHMNRKTDPLYIVNDVPNGTSVLSKSLQMLGVIKSSIKIAKKVESGPRNSYLRWKDKGFNSTSGVPSSLALEA